MLKAKMTLSDLSLPHDRIDYIRDNHKMETSFELRAQLKVSKRKAGVLSGEGIDSLDLEWKETCDWFEFSNNKWTFKGTDPNDTDLYALNPMSKTFKDWREARYFFACVEEIGNAPPPGLQDAVAKAGSAEGKDKAAKHWIAENGFEWMVRVAVDRPALGMQPTAGSGGGAGKSLVTTNSRRRVLYFDLGFKGSPLRVTATLIMESVDGRPTLQKFLVPKLTREEANDETKLENWRQELRQELQQGQA